MVRFASTKQKAFTIIELLIVILMIGILASTAVSTFTVYQIRSKATEAVVGLEKMVAGQTAYYQKENSFIEAGPTNIPPAGNRTAVNFAADPRWLDLNFGFTTPIYFGYQAVLASPSQVDCQAIGDLNINGITSLYQRSVIIDASGAVRAQGMFVFDELE